MKISRLTNITLGVNDLDKAKEFYEAVLDTPPNTSTDDIVFIELPGTWVSLYSLEELAKDISPEVPTTRAGFSGITLSHNVGSKDYFIFSKKQKPPFHKNQNMPPKTTSHNVGSKDEVLAVMERAKLAGANIVKEPQDVFWGGFSGYFADLDGHYWEVVWGPMFGFSENGELRLKDNEKS